MLMAAPSAASAVTFTVNSVADAADDNAGDGSCHTAQNECTLRAAIAEANASAAAADTVAFAIGVGQVTIVPGSQLPEITSPLTIDGATQPMGLALPGLPRVELDGVSAGTSTDGLIVSAGNTHIRGLTIGRFGRYGVFMYSPGVQRGGNTLRGSFIGTDSSGQFARPNRSGVVIYASGANVIGGSQAGQRNVISGNGRIPGPLNEGDGVQIYGFGADGNVVEGNHIGVGADGTTQVANTHSGISITDSAVGPNDVAVNTRVGGSEPGSRNVIAGNGTDAFGCNPAMSGTVICNGITNYVADNTRIQGNYIGVNAAGEPLGNAGEGVILGNDVSGALVGVDVDDLDQRNVIAANGRNGIVIAHGSDNRVTGNRIGARPDGASAALVNPGATGRIGVLVTQATTGQPAADTQIGGAGPLANLISGNRIGVRVFGTASGTVVWGNRIGTNAAGTAAVPNTEDGIDLFGAAGTEIGTGVDHGNLISGNGSNGVRIRDAGAAENALEGNRIGTAANGIDPLPNGAAGVSIENGAHDNLVGPLLRDPDPGALCTRPCNIIARNTGAGVRVTGSGSAENTIVSNQLSDNGGLGIDLVADPANANEPPVTPNDTGDPDSGPNARVNFPSGVASYRNPQSGQVSIEGIVDTVDPQAGRVDVYGVTEVDPSGFGEGLVHAERVTPFANGRFSVDTVGGFAYWSATFTDKDGNTSEFSPVCGDPDGDGHPDTDRDGLCDDWETKGIDYDGDGTAELPLHQAPFFADPARKDLFVEVDYMDALLHDESPVAGALEDVRMAFDNAPVDGNLGVSLNLSPGSANRLDDDVSHIDVMPTEMRGPGAADDFVDIRDGTAGNPCDGFFGTAAERGSPDCADILAAKRLAFRYALFAHSFSEAPNSSGRADDLIGDDFIVTLETWNDASMIRMNGGAGGCGGATACRRRGEAGTFMHELGHTLGLGHGGGDDQQFKPNYLSVMNYLAQFANVLPSRPLDYSRWALPTLTETSLDETKGIDGGVPPAGLAATWPQTAFSYLAVDGTCHMWPTPSTGAIDWDLDGNSTEVSVRRGINDPASVLRALGQPTSGCSQAAFQSATLPGFDDWANIVFSPRASAGWLNTGTFLPGASADEELTLDAALDAAEETDADGDGVANADDNCAGAANPGQADADGDGAGDACDSDAPGPGPGPGGGGSGGGGSGGTGGGGSGGAGGGEPPPPADTTATVVGLGRLSFRRGTLRLSVTCPATEPDGCAGTLSVRRGRLTLARGRFSLVAGKKATVRLRVSKRALRALRRTRRVRLVVSAVTRDPAGNVGKRSRGYVLRLRRG
jgi:CSLREA domain-containing protein